MRILETTCTTDIVPIVIDNNGVQIKIDPKNLRYMRVLAFEILQATISNPDEVQHYTDNLRWWSNYSGLHKLSLSEIFDLLK